MKLFLLLFVATFFHTEMTLSIDCQWAERISGSGDERGYSTVVDGLGNVYVAGYFNSPTLNFNNGILLTSSGTTDAYVAKYNSNGTCQWAQRISGTNDDGITNVEIDSSGNVYVSGSFDSPTLGFNNGISLTNGGLMDGYICKFNSGGTCQWAQKISGTDVDRVYSIAVDGSGNVYVAGNFNSRSFKFNNSISLTNSNLGYSDAFIAKYNTSGTCQWAEMIYGSDHDHANSLALDGLGNVYVSGFYLSNTLNFNNGISLANSGSYDIYIAKYNNNGTCQWAQKMSGTSDDRSFSTVTDSSGNAYVVGYFASPNLSFNNGISLNNSGQTDGFITKYNSNGICQWAEKISGTGIDYTWCIAVDNSGSIYITGDFQSNIISFNNGNSLTNSGQADGYIAQYNSGGFCQWVQKISGTGDDRVYGIAVDFLDNVYVSGWFSGSTLDFGNGKSLNNSNKGTLDGFVAKYGIKPTPPTTTSIDGPCGVSIDYMFTDDSYVEVKVLNQRNVDVKITRKDSQHIEVHVKLTDDTKSGYVEFEAIDDYGNKTTISKNLITSYSDQGLIINPHPIFDISKVAVSTTVCKEIEITNPTKDQLVLDQVYFTKWQYYSFPQSQLPMVFGPNETKKFTICFTPLATSKLPYLDTLILRAGCIGGDLFVTGLSDNLNLDGLSECDTKVKVTLRNSNLSHIYPAIAPTPSNRTSKLIISLENNSDVSIELLDCLGTKVKEEHYLALPKGENNIFLDFSNNATGLYYLIVRAEGNQDVLKVIIGK